MVVGLVSEPLLVIFGLVALGIVVVEWTVQTWSDHATGDPATNRRIRNRLMNPIEFPLAGVLAVGLVVISFSRVFLAVSSFGAVWVAAVLGGVVVLLGALLATRPRASANLVVGLLLVAAVVVIGLGVAGSVAGERDFHPAGEEHEEEAEEEGAVARPMGAWWTA